MPTTRELIAYGRTEEEVAKKIDAEFVLYQTLDDLKKACQDAAICIEWSEWSDSIDGPAPENFECSCFDGNYVRIIEREWIMK